MNWLRLEAPMRRWAMRAQPVCAFCWTKCLKKSGRQDRNFYLNGTHSVIEWVRFWRCYVQVNLLSCPVFFTTLCCLHSTSPHNRSAEQAGIANQLPLGSQSQEDLCRSRPSDEGLSLC